MAAFDLNTALAGATLVVDGHDTWMVTDFGKASAGAPMPYQAVVKGKITYFNYSGVSRDGTITLLISDAEIDDSIATTRGDTIIRGSGDSETSYTLISLNYREQVAVRMLQAMLPTMGNALSFDDGKIKNLVARAFYIATEFTNQAINIRTTNSSEQETGIDVDPNKLTDYTDQILYNISQSLKEGIAVQGKSGNEVTPLQININKTPIEKVNSTIIIKAAIFETKYIRFRFTSGMAYSDVSVYVECSVKEGEATDTRKIGFILYKGTVAIIEELDAKVTEITSINAVAMRGKDVSDGNTYEIGTESI